MDNAEHFTENSRLSDFRATFATTDVMMLRRVGTEGGHSGMAGLGLIQSQDVTISLRILSLQREIDSPLCMTLHGDLGLYWFE